MKKMILAVLALFLFLSPALAAEVIEFQAEYVERDNGETTRGKIYIADGKSRYETNGGKEIVVTRQDKKIIWLIFPKLAKYVEQPYLGAPQQSFAIPGEEDNGSVTREFIDYEWISSFRLRKFLVTVNYGDGEDKYYEWLRDGFPVPVKMESLDGKTSFEYQKIKIAPQDPNLFSTPRYKKADMEEIMAAEDAAAAKNVKKKKK